jgi:hypothetical protein
VPHRHAQDHVFGAGTVHVGAATALAVACASMLARIAVVDQALSMLRSATASTLTAATAIAHHRVRRAESTKLLATKRHDAGPAVAGHDLDIRFVEKFHGMKKAPLGGAFRHVDPAASGAGGSVAWAASRGTGCNCSGSMLTV